jgi:hypothetical protein
MHLALVLPVIACSTLHAQEKPKESASHPPATASAPGATESKQTASPSAGQGRPPIVIPANTDEAEVRLQLTLDARPEPGDLELGLLTTEQNQDQRIIPTVQLRPVPAGKDRTWDVVLNVTGLVPFGDSTAPLLYRGRQVETLRFHKTGLIVRPPADGPVVAREREGTLLLVLENPSRFEYKSVKARVRFQNADVCAFTADWFGGSPQQSSGDCLNGDQWSAFEVRGFSQVSLRAPIQPEWFRDPGTEFARGANRKGTLTLRYQGDGQPQVFEQNVPLDVRFDPGNWSLTKSMLTVAWWLIVGALFAMVLRVSIPNFRRKKALKDQLNEARRATGEISDQVDSQLRVLLRVDRLALDQRRREGWVLGPAFADVAARVDAGLTTLKRKIALVQRLDAAACRSETVLARPVSPTRVDIIERNLTAACDALKSDQLSDPDWVFIQQRLEAADKALNEPTEEEKQAFEALLSQRWKSIRDHFGPDPQDPNELRVPATLTSMAGCFPDGALLPATADVDGTNWINSIGVVRADLQLTALELVRDVQFLAPALNDNQKWTDAMKRLTEWLATPAINNLLMARQKLLQLAEGVSEENIVCALENGQAQIELDPQFVNPNQTVRMTVRFRDPRLNGASARGAVECEWRFSPPTVKTWRGGAAKDATQPQDYRECGWKVHRYFEPGILEQTVETYFFWNGQPVLAKSDSKPVKCTRTVAPQERIQHRKDKWELRRRALPEALQLVAALLVPLAALAITTTGEAASGRWWDLVGLGFGSETIRNILTGQQQSAT